MFAIARKLFKQAVLLGVLLGCLFGVLLFGAALYFNPGLPSVEMLRVAQLQVPLRIYTRDGMLIGSFGEKHRRELTYKEIPPQFVQALLAAEDDRFLQHFGVDVIGLARASYELAKYGRIRSGGSTITMQVARNYLLTRERSFARKFREILLSLKIESELDKEQILELYVNQIFLGHRAYGIASAAEVYYGIDISDLRLEQLAMLAGLPKAPSVLNPITNPTRAKIRRDWILGRMYRLGYIDQSQLTKARGTLVVASYHRPRTEVEAPHMAEQVRQQVLSLISTSAYTDGYSVYTTLDGRLQTAAVQSVADGLYAYDKRHGFREAANFVEQVTPEVLEYLLSEEIRNHLAVQQQPPEEDENNNALNVPVSVSVSQGVAADIDPSSEPETEAELEEGEEEPTPPEIVALSDLLHGKMRYQGIKPALVLGTNIAGDQAHLMMPEGTVVSLDWDKERYRWARPSASVNNLGPVPQHFADLFDVGDLVYLKRLPHGDDWELTQIPEVQAALISLDPRNGAVRALVGGFDYSSSRYNRVYQARPQIGSNIKPFIYSAALASGFTPASVINDAPVVFQDSALEKVWRPDNSSGVFHGPTRLREALLNSRNLVSVRLLRKIGINYAVNFLRKFGLDTENIPRNLSIALGSTGATPLAIARGYSVFANGGHLIDPHLIERIEDENGRVVWQPIPKTVCEAPCPNAIEQPQLRTEMGLDNKPLPRPGQPPPIAPRMLDERIAYIMWDFLRDAVQRGTARSARKLRRADIAGKTATTNEATDTWFTGFNTQLVTTVWMGRDQPSTLGNNEWGNTTALPIWIDYTAKVLENLLDKPPKLPPNLVSVRIDKSTGNRSEVDSRKTTRLEWFRAEFAPPLKQARQVNSRLTLEDIF